MINILVIDDNREITTMLESVLSSESCRVQTAHNGMTGLQLLANSPCDVVITDIIMPDSKGFDVISEINRIKPRPRVIAMTGGTASLSREYLSSMAKGLNVQQVLFKPFSIDELLVSIFQHEGSTDTAGQIPDPEERTAGGAFSTL